MEVIRSRFSILEWLINTALVVILMLLPQPAIRNGQSGQSSLLDISIFSILLGASIFSF